MNTLMLLGLFSGSLVAAPCISLDATLHTYAGQIQITGACVTAMTYKSTDLRIVAYDTGDGIFHNGFEGMP